MTNLINQFLNTANGWFFDHGMKVVFIIIVASILHIFVGRIIDRVIKKVIKQGVASHEAEVKRENTLIQVITGVANIAIWLIVILMVMSEFGIAIAPVLAAAGVAGIALGFGGQYLIRDVISGIFILLENQYRAGDVVCFNGTCGLVEAVSLRMTTLRDLDGTVHHIPHGEVNIVSNMTKGFSRINLNIGISYNANLEHVIKVVDEVGESLTNDEVWKDLIIKQPKFLRVEEFADSAVVIKILGDTLPSRQWEVAGELRKRLKIAFDNEGIEIPFPQMTLHQPKTK